jgi:hypothetical protein
MKANVFLAAMNLFRLFSKFKTLLFQNYCPGFITKTTPSGSKITENRMALNIDEVKISIGLSTNRKTDNQLVEEIKSD